MNDDMIASQIKSIQTLGTIAIIASPISLIFGGVLLSLVALICAIVGRSKLKALQAQATVSEDIIGTLKRQNTVGLVVSAATLVINGIAFALAFGMLMDSVQSGDFSQIAEVFGMDPSAAEQAPDTTQNTSVWDG